MSIALLPLSSDDQFRTTAYGGFINVVFMEWYKVKEWYWNGKGRERGWGRGVTTLRITGQVPVESYSLGGRS
jgi:hypothetical protein